MATENDGEQVQVNVTLTSRELCECRDLARVDMNGPAIRSMMRLGMACERTRLAKEEIGNVRENA